jgi:hypothetical protein
MMMSSQLKGVRTFKCKFKERKMENGNWKLGKLD